MRHVQLKFEYTNSNFIKFNPLFQTKFCVHEQNNDQSTELSTSLRAQHSNRRLQVQKIRGVVSITTEESGTSGVEGITSSLKMPRRVRTPPRRIPPQPSAKDGQRAGSSRNQPSQRDLQEAGPSRAGTRSSRRSRSEPRRSANRDDSSSSSEDDRSYRLPRMSRSRSEQRNARPTRLHGARVLREITRLQLTTDLLIPKLPFARLIREVLQQYSQRNLRITPEALLCLQESSEIYLTQMFEDAYRCTLHRERVTMMPKDMNLALYLRERWAR